jgi:acetyltransferase EpsM
MDRTMSRRLVILGGPGDGLVIAEAAMRASAAGAPYTLFGFLNDAIAKGEQIYGLPVLGRFEDWRQCSDDVVFCPAAQKVRDMPRRARRIEELGIPPSRWATVQHPISVVARDVSLGVGCFVASFVTVQPGGRIGDFASLRSGASVGHHATIDEHAYVGPNATMCGRTHLMRGAHLGPNAVILDHMTVGRYAVIGIGATVTKNVRDFAVMMGNPARRVGIVRENGVIPADPETNA